MGNKNIQNLEAAKFEESSVYPKTTVRVKIADGQSTVGSVYTVPPNTITKTYNGNQTSTVLVSPTSGKKLQIIGVIMTSNASVFTATVKFETSDITVQEHFEQGTLGSYIPCNLTGAVDEELKFTVDNSDDKDWFITINYAEVDA